MVIKNFRKNIFSLYITMKKENYMLQIAQENHVLKLKCNELQNEIQDLKEKQEKLYLIHANTVLVLQNKKTKIPRSFSF